MIEGDYFNKVVDGDTKQMLNLSPVTRELKSLSESIKNIPSEEISINNLDEVKLHLRTELAHAINKLIPIIKEIEIPKSVKITNFQEQKESHEADLTELLKSLDDIKAALSSIELNPTINVSPSPAPKITIPKPNVNVTSEVDFSPLLKALKPLSLISDKASKPITVRNSDGRRFEKALEKSTEKMAKVLVNNNGMTNTDFRDTRRKYDDPLARYKVANVDDDGSPNYYGYVAANGDWYIMKETLSPGANTYRYSVGVNNFPSNWSGRAVLEYSYIYEVNI